MHAFDVPQLAAFAYIKTDKAAAYIFSSKQLGACFGYIKSSKELYLWTLAFQSTPFEASLAASYREFSEATRSKSSYFPIVSCLFFSLAAFRLWYRCSRLSSLVTI